MISKEEVEKLAKLARIELSEEEKTQFQGEIDAILGFVAKVKEAAETAPEANFSSTNVLREDAVVHGRKEFTEKLLNASPEREGDFVKVKRILE